MALLGVLGLAWGDWSMQDNPIGLVTPDARGGAYTDSNGKDKRGIALEPSGGRRRNDPPPGGTPVGGALLKIIALRAN